MPTQAETTNVAALHAPHRSVVQISRLPFLVLLLLVAIAGAFNVLTFAPFGYWWLQFPLLALLFWLIQHTPSVKRSALIGLAFSWGALVCNVHWLYISMHRYGGMPSWMAILAVGLLGLAMGTYPAAAAAMTTWLRKRWTLSLPASLLLVAAPLWALSEWVRGWMFTGFSWTVSGYAHTSSPLGGFAPLIGVYGIGLLAALGAALLLLLPAKKWPLATLVLLLGAGWGLSALPWTQATGRPISVRLLQGNVPQDRKFESGHVATTLAEYDMAIRSTPADLIATPETALPMLSHQLPQDYVARLVQYAKTSGSHIALGLPVSDGPRQYANSVLGIAPHLQQLETPRFYRYDKHHLVPFGEFIPPGFRWFVNMMHIPLGDFTRGELLQQPFGIKDQWVLPNICYEDLFGEEIAAQLAAGHSGIIPQATILLNVSNIAWFGDSIALPQHLQISQMRSMEMRRPMLRATNTGATAVVDRFGKVSAQLAPFTKDSLSASVQGYAGVTPYILLGNKTVVLLALLMIGGAWLLRRKAAG